MVKSFSSSDNAGRLPNEHSQLGICAQVGSPLAIRQTVLVASRRSFDQSLADVGVGWRSSGQPSSMRARARASARASSSAAASTAGSGAARFSFVGVRRSGDRSGDRRNVGMAGADQCPTTNACNKS